MKSILIKFPDERVRASALQTLPGIAKANVRVYHAVDHQETYAWLCASACAGTDVDALQAALETRHPQAQVVSLMLTTDVAGHASGQAAPWFYMVETDIKPAAQTDFDRWYETEHLPGLAAVPGTVRARRYLAPEGSPRYYACYELAQREAFGSAPWLAVRATSWSDRVRPNFINTKRTMFRLVQDDAEVESCPA